MEKWNMLIDFTLIAGISVQSIFVLFLLKSNSGFSKKLLSLFLINSIFFLLYYYAFLHRSRYLGGIAMVFGSGAGFLLGPVLLFYIRSLILSSRKIIKPLLINLIPFYIFWLTISFPISLTMLFGFFEKYHQAYLKVADYINLIENLYFLIFIWISYKLLQKIQMAQDQIYSSIETTTLKWISYLIIGLIMIVLLDSIFSIYELIFPPISWNIGTLIAFSFILLYSILGYIGMFQTHILLPDFLWTKEGNSLIKPLENKEKYSKPIKHLDIFSEAEIENLKIKLNEILTTKKLYLNDSLSLSALAEELGIGDKKLSELLNQQMNTNFYNLINEYRVNEVMHRIRDKENNKYTLLSMAYECGFQSKTSFNRVFKQKTGMSPSQYKEFIAPR